jgi:hypothetical protein
LPRNNKLWRARSLGLSAVLAAVVVSAIAASHGCTTTNTITTQVDFYGPSGLTIAPAKDRDLLFIASTGGDDLRAISICNTPVPDGGTVADTTCTDLEDFHFLPGPIRLFPGSFPVGNRPVRLASVNLRDAEGGVVGGVLVAGVAAQVSVDGGISATADAGTLAALPALLLVDSVNVLAATRREATIKVPIAISLDAPPIDVVTTDVPTGTKPIAGMTQLAYVLTEANVASNVPAELSQLTLTPTKDGPVAAVTGRCSLSITATRLALIPRTFHATTGFEEPPSPFTTTIPPMTGTVAPCTIKRRLVATDPLTGKPRGLASIALSPAYITTDEQEQIDRDGGYDGDGGYPAGAMLLGASTDGVVVMIRRDKGIPYPIPPFKTLPDGGTNIVISGGQNAYVSDDDGGVFTYTTNPDGGAPLFGYEPNDAGVLVYVGPIPGVSAQPMEPLRLNGLAREVAFFKTPLTCNSRNIVTGQPCELVSVGASQSSYLSVAFPLVATVTSTDGTVVFIDAADRRFVSDTRDATAGSTGFQAAVNSSYTFAPAQPLSRSAPVLNFTPADTTSNECNAKTAPVTCKPLGWSQAGVARQSTWRAIWHAQLPGLERQGGTLTRDASGALRFTVPPGIDLSRWTDPALPDAMGVGDALAVAAFTAAPNGGALCAFLANENLTPLAREYTITAIGSNYLLLDDQNTLESGTAAHDATPPECLTGGVGAVVEVRTAGTNPWLILQGNLIHGRARNGTQFTATETRFDYPLQYVLYPDAPGLLPTIANDIAVSFTITGNDPVTPQSTFTWSIGSGQSPTRVSDTGSLGGFAGAVITYTSLKLPGNLVFFSSTGSNTVIQIDPQLLGVLNGVISYR